MKEIWYFVVGFGFGLFLGVAMVMDSYNAFIKTAIEKNVAEWRIDSKTGDREFHWLSPTKIEKQ